MKPWKVRLVATWCLLAVPVLVLVVAATEVVKWTATAWWHCLDWREERRCLGILMLELWRALLSGKRQ